MHIPEKHIPEKTDCYWLEETSFASNPQVSLNSLATEMFGREYVGQQTEGCQPRGIQKYDMSNEDNCLDWHEPQAIEEWLAKNPEDYEFDFVLSREGPYIPNVLAHLILNDVLPYGEYLINIDW